MRLWLRPAAGVAIAAMLASCDDFKSKPSTAQPAPTQAPSAPAGVGPLPAVAAPPASAIVAPPANVQATETIAPPASTTPQGKSIDTADLTSLAPGQDRRDVIIRAQVILDRAHLSPGVIDGRTGTNFRRALAAFEASRGSGSAQGAMADLDSKAWTDLITADNTPATEDYVITDDDVRGPFIGTVPKDWAMQAKLPYLGYSNPLQLLAEKFHMDQDLLRALNPGVDFGSAGTRIVVLRPGSEPLPRVVKVEVDKSNNEVRAYGSGGAMVAQFPATVGSTERPAPSGTFAVKAVAFNPSYVYDPMRLTFGDRSLGKLTIRPGPNNPVGSTWIDLTLPTYGIHGSPDPTKIGKTASHGCVRLTNWDAATLARAVSKNTPVVFVGSESAG